MDNTKRVVTGSYY